MEASPRKIRHENPPPSRSGPQNPPKNRPRNPPPKSAIKIRLEIRLPTKSALDFTNKRFPALSWGLLAPLDASWRLLAFLGPILWPSDASWHCLWSLGAAWRLPGLSAASWALLVLLGACGCPLASAGVCVCVCVCVCVRVRVCLQKRLAFVTIGYCLLSADTPVQHVAARSSVLGLERGGALSVSKKQFFAKLQLRCLVSVIPGWNPSIQVFDPVVALRNFV